MKMLRSALVVGLVVLAACGETTGADEAKIGAGGAQSSGSCTTQAQAGNRACVPSEAKAGTALSIQVDLTQGCLPCFATVAACAVDVHGAEITVGMQTRTCTPTGTAACPTICATPSTTCQLPALPAGTYTVHVTGESDTSFAPRTLVVTEAATATGCTLDRIDAVVPAVDVTKYSQACTKDEDCTAVSATVCKPCTCADSVIAATDVPAFQAERRAASSQCARPTEVTECAGCPGPTATCDVAAGRCKGPR